MKLFDFLSDAKEILLAPLTNILCGGGVLLLCAAFVNYDKKSGLSLHGTVQWAMLVAGFVLIAFGGILFFLTNRGTGIRTLNYEKGIQLKRGELSIFIKSGEIQAIPNTTRNSAIVLPANTTFVDDCAADRRTAMGAFFTERFPEEIGALPNSLREILAARGLQPNASGQYLPGTTVILPERFAKPAKVIVTASTTRMPGTGITSTPHFICSCVEEILKITADQRVDTVYVPILGSGHGGVERGMALLFLLLGFFHFSNVYHHIKRVHIVVHPKDVPNLNQSKELRQVLAL